MDANCLVLEQSKNDYYVVSRLPALPEHIREHQTGRFLEPGYGERYKR